MQSECELIGILAGRLFNEFPPCFSVVDITTMSDKTKSCEISDIYNLTMSKAIVRHCFGLRLPPRQEVGFYYGIRR